MQTGTTPGNGRGAAACRTGLRASPIPPWPSSRKREELAMEHSISFPLKGQQDRKLLFVYKHDK